MQNMPGETEQQLKELQEKINEQLEVIVEISTKLRYVNEDVKRLVVLHREITLGLHNKN